MIEESSCSFADRNPHDDLVIIEESGISFSEISVSCTDPLLQSHDLQDSLCDQRESDSRRFIHFGFEGDLRCTKPFMVPKSYLKRTNQRPAHTLNKRIKDSTKGQDGNSDISRAGQL